MIRQTLINVGVCLLVVCSGCAQNAAQPTSVIPSALSSTTTQPATSALSMSAGSTSAGSTSAVPPALAAGYAPTPMDQHTASLKWVTTQTSSDVPALLAAGDYTDFYISSIRELPNYGGTEPAWSSVNLHEDAFQHTSDPATLTLVPSASAVTLDWKPDARGVTIGGYAIYRGTSATTLSQVATVTAGQTSYKATGLKLGQKYFFSVQSIVGGAPTPYSWAESAVASAPSTLNLDSPSYSLSAQPSPGGRVTLSVSVHGSSSGAHMVLQTEVAPTTTTKPVSTSMSLGASDVYHGAVTVSIPSGFYGGIAYRVVDTTSGASLPAAGQSYYVTSPNNRLHFGRYPNNYLMNPASPAWQKLLASYITSIAQSGKYSGALLDDTDEYFVQTRPDAFPYGYSDQQYLSGVAAQYTALRATVPSAIQLSANGFSNTAVAAALASHVNGAEVEEFAYDVSSWHYAPTSYWIGTMNNVYNIAQNLHLKTRVLSDGSTDAGVRSYIFGSYLLVSSPNTYYDIETSLGMGQTFPEIAAPLGSPLQTFRNISSAWVAAHGAYERQFANGWVVVNPSQSASTATIPVPAGYSRLVINGGSMEQGGTTSLLKVSSVKLGPDQAAIFVGKSGTVPTPTPTPVVTPGTSPTPARSPSANLFRPSSQGTLYTGSVFTLAAGNPSGLMMSSTPSGSSGGIGITVPAGGTITHGWLTTAGVLAKTSWPSGTYTIHYSIVGANTALTLSKVEVLRVNSTGSSVLAEVGYQNLSQTLQAATYTYSISGAGQPSTAINDLLGVRFTVRNASASPQKFYFQVGPSGTATVQAPW